jgi:hypothetical protein
MLLNDHVVDLIEEGFDVAARIAHLADLTLIGRRIAPIHFALCVQRLLTCSVMVCRHDRPTLPGTTASNSAICRLGPSGIFPLRMELRNRYE